MIVFSTFFSLRLVFIVSVYLKVEYNWLMEEEIQDKAKRSPSDRGGLGTFIHAHIR